MFVPMRKLSFENLILFAAFYREQALSINFCVLLLMLSLIEWILLLSNLSIDLIPNSVVRGSLMQIRNLFLSFIGEQTRINKF